MNDKDNEPEQGDPEEYDEPYDEGNGEDGADDLPAVARREDPDVLLDVPQLHVDEINLEVDDLRARVLLQAEVLDMLKLNVGADVALGRVQLDIKGVDAQALLKVRLDNVAQVIGRVLTTIDRNPQILEQITAGLGSATRELGSGAGEAVGELGRGASKAVEDVGEGAGGAVEDVGKGASKAVEDVGEGAGGAVEDVGEGAGGAVEDVGKGASKAVEDVGEGAGGAVEDVGEGAGGAVEDVGEGAAETTHDVGRSAGKTIDESGRTVREAGDKATRTAKRAGEGAAGRSADSEERPKRRRSARKHERADQP